MLTVFLRTACASPSLTIHLGCKCIPLNVPETVQGACLLVLERWAHLRRNHCISNGIGISETWPCAGSCSLSLCTMTLWTCSEWFVWLLQTQKLSVVWVINYAFAYIKKKKGRGKKKKEGEGKRNCLFLISASSCHMDLDFVMLYFITALQACLPWGFPELGPWWIFAGWGIMALEKCPLEPSWRVMEKLSK